MTFHLHAKARWDGFKLELDEWHQVFGGSRKLEGEALRAQLERELAKMGMIDVRVQLVQGKKKPEGR